MSAGKWRLNERVASIAPSLTLGITSKAKELKAAGKTVYSFAAGEPDFDTPAHIKDAAVKALAEGKTKYAPNPGLPELRTAIAAKLEQENGLCYTPDQVIVSNGAKHSLYNLFMALLQAGDEVLVPAPYWLSYPEMIRMAGGETVAMPTSEENGYKITPEQIDAMATSRTRAIILNSPSNPIGIVYSRAELEALAAAALRKNLVIVAYEIYEKVVYEGTEHVSIGSLAPEVLEATVTINGFSKAYSMPGWRLGYLAGPKSVVKAVSALQSHSTSGAVTFAQYGALAALKGSQDCVSEMVRAFDERRVYLYDRLCRLPGVSCVKPLGAFYMLPRIDAFGMDSVTFAERLLESQGVAVVPGAPFGADATMRLSYACGMDNIRNGLDRLEAFLAAL
jgi:aspartate aminotransferase